MYLKHIATASKQSQRLQFAVWQGPSLFDFFGYLRIAIFAVMALFATALRLLFLLFHLSILAFVLVLFILLILFLILLFGILLSILLFILLQIPNGETFSKQIYFPKIGKNSQLESNNRPIKVKSVLSFASAAQAAEHLGRAIWELPRDQSWHDGIMA